MAADISLSMELQAKQLIGELRSLEGHIKTFAGSAEQHGKRAASGLTGGFGKGLGGLGSALSGTLGALGIGVGVGAVVGEFNAIIEKAHEIHHEASRFGLDAEQLQLIGNAAKEEGLSLGQVARALNLLQINGAAASDGTGKQADALARLGISFEQFSKANAAEKFLLLADAYKKSAKDGQAYADAATLIGKRNTEMIPLLEQGSEAIRKQGTEMGILSTEATERLNGAYQAMQKLENRVATNVGNSITWLDKFNAKMESVGDTFRNFLIKGGYGNKENTSLLGSGKLDQLEGGGGSFAGKGAGSSWGDEPVSSSIDAPLGPNATDAELAAKYAKEQGFDPANIDVKTAARFQRQKEQFNADNKAIADASVGDRIPGSVDDSLENVRAAGLESQLQSDLSDQEIQSSITSAPSLETLLQTIADNTATIGANQ